MTKSDLMESLSKAPFSQAKSKSEPGFGRAFTAILFAILVVALLLSVVAGTSVYRNLNNIRAGADDARLGLSLITNNVRANDAIDAIAVGKGPEGRSLVLVERLDSGTYETRIYSYQGNIVEEYALANAAYTPDKAVMVCASETFEFSYENGLLTIVTDQGSADVALRSVRGA